MSRLEKVDYPFLNQEVYFRQMNNGMTVYYVPKKDFQERSAVLTVSFGSIDTKFTKNGESITFPSGIAHFLEHQLFESETDDVGVQFSKLGSETNAYTSFDRTAYFFSTVGSFEESLKLLLNFTETLHVSQETIDKEKKIIEQEIAMYQDDPDFRLYNGVLANLFPETALATDVAGTVESINQISLEDLKENFHTFYRPDFKNLVLVGDFDVREVDRVVRKWERPKRKTLPEILKTPLVLEPPVVKSSIRMEIATPKLALGFRSQLTSSLSLAEKKLALRIFLTLLFGWTSQRYQDWYDKGKIDDSFDIEIEISDRYCFVIIVLDTEQPIAMATQIRKVLNTFNRDKDLTSNHLDIIKHEFYGEFIRSLDSIEDLGHQLLQYQDGRHSYFDLPNVLMNLDLETVISIGQEFFGQAERTEFIIFPK